MIDLLFGNSYEALLMTIALLAAIPYGIWQLIKRVVGRRGGSDGDARTGR